MSVFLLAWALMLIFLYLKLDPFVYLVLGLGCVFRLYTWKFHKRAILFMFAVGLFGWGIESLESYFGVLSVSYSPPKPQPLWMILLWAYFVAVTFDQFKSFVDRYWKSFLYGIYSLPGSYYFVSKLGIAEIGVSTPMFFLINGTVGGLVLVFSHFVYYSLKVDHLD